MHGTWPTCIVESLADLLPPHYFAVPSVTLGAIEVDVGTFAANANDASQNGGVATAVYSPPAPPVTSVVDWSIMNSSEVLIHEGGGKLVAAIELVSEANKDRPATRQAFAFKCASYLYQGCSLIIFDANDIRSGNLHAELLNLVAPMLAGSLHTDAARYCVAYRPLAISKSQSKFDIWPFSLTLGEVLPVVPLWLAPDLVLPLDLEISYLKACRLLRLS